MLRKLCCFTSNCSRKTLCESKLCQATRMSNTQGCSYSEERANKAKMHSAPVACCILQHTESDSSCSRRSPQVVDRADLLPTIELKTDVNIFRPPTSPAKPAFLCWRCCMCFLRLWLWIRGHVPNCALDFRPQGPSLVLIVQVLAVGSFFLHLPGQRHLFANRLP